jgi:hypothetical protein
MSGESDIVFRLRCLCVGQAVDVACERDELCQEAADEITSLRAELATVKAQTRRDAIPGCECDAPPGAVCKQPDCKRLPPRPAPSRPSDEPQNTSEA